LKALEMMVMVIHMQAIHIHILIHTHIVMEVMKIMIRRKRMNLMTITMTTRNINMIIRNMNMIIRNMNMITKKINIIIIMKKGMKMDIIMKILKKIL
jgi:hypothetical protein